LHRDSIKARRPLPDYDDPRHSRRQRRQCDCRWPRQVSGTGRASGLT
jgi:hypothetical protein